MALEPEQISVHDAPDPELIDMTGRLQIALVLTAPVFALEMGGHLGWHPLPLNWSNLDFATARDAGGTVGRCAVLRPRLALAGQP